VQAAAAGGSAPKNILGGERRRSTSIAGSWTATSAFFWTIGLTWFPAMVASQELSARVRELTSDHQMQPNRLDKQHVIDMLIARTDAGGMVLVDSDLYPVEPLNTSYADIVLPAAGWGEEAFTRCNSERRLRLYS
jgi:arsenite oxidase large subunit